MRASRPISKWVSLSAAVALLLGSTSEAAVLVYEGFDYPVGATLDGQIGGVGFKQVEGSTNQMPWFEDRSGNFDERDRYSATLQSGNLPVPATAGDLERSGNSLLLQPITGGRDVFRPLAITAPESGALWMSFVMIRTAGFAGSNAHLIVLSPTPEYFGNANSLQIGDVDESNPYSIKGGDDLSSSAVSIANGAPAFLVVKMTFQPGNDRFDLFVNPTFNGEPLTPDATVTNFDLPAINYLGIVSYSAATNRLWGFDEIRIGESYADVTPKSVPEPRVTLMGLVGAAALGFRRRRR